MSNYLMTISDAMPTKSVLLIRPIIAFPASKHGASQRRSLPQSGPQFVPPAIIQGIELSGQLQIPLQISPSSLLAFGQSTRLCNASPGFRSDGGLGCGSGSLFLNGGSSDFHFLVISVIGFIIFHVESDDSVSDVVHQLGIVVVGR